MARRYSFKKIFFGEAGLCLSCSAETFFALCDKNDGSECPRCPNCALGITKGRCNGLKKHLIHKTTTGSRTKIYEFYKGKNKINASVEPTSAQLNPIENQENKELEHE